MAGFLWHEVHKGHTAPDKIINNMVLSTLTTEINISRFVAEKWYSVELRELLKNNLKNLSKMACNRNALLKSSVGFKIDFEINLLAYRYSKEDEETSLKL